MQLTVCLQGGNVLRIAPVGSGRFFNDIHSLLPQYHVYYVLVVKVEILVHINIEPDKKLLFNLIY